jgi:glyoxylase-like metal-dependent hydrolase (beta-lactamase superfamily II)
VEPVTFDVAAGVTAIDTFMGGRERYTAAYLLHADEPTLVETGPGTSVEPVARALDALGIAPDALAHIVLTHIHLDHAGGVGALAARFPRATVWVHERGARHLADPTRLVDSATRVYGEERMTWLFGPVEPVPGDRLKVLQDRQALDIGGRSLLALDTPGHASHHLALVDSSTGVVFAGDALGIHVPDLPVLRPATPPPDFDLELAVASIERIREVASATLLFAHFGPIADVDRTCDLAVRRLNEWTDAVRRAMRSTMDLDEIVEVLSRDAARETITGAEAQLDLDRLETLAGIRMNASGIARYLTKRAEREADTGGGSRDPTTDNIGGQTS